MRHIILQYLGRKLHGNKCITFLCERAHDGVSFLTDRYIWPDKFWVLTADSISEFLCFQAWEND